MRNQRSHGAEHTACLLRWQLRRSLAEDAVHYSCGLCMLEGRLLWEAGLLREGGLLLEASRLGCEAVC